MVLYSHSGLLIMLLLRLCQARDAPLPTTDPESAPTSLGDVINAVKAAFQQAIQISAEDTIHEALEQVTEVLVSRKTSADQLPAAENVADPTTEAADVVRVSEEEAAEPVAHMSESNEQTDEESIQGRTRDAGRSQNTDEEPMRLSAQESFQDAVPKPVKTAKESAEPVQESVKSGASSDSQGPQIAEEAEAIYEHFAKDTKTEESPVQAFTTDTQNEGETGRAAPEINGGGTKVEGAPGEPEEEFAEEEEAWKPRRLWKIAEKEKVEVTTGGEVVHLEQLQKDEHVKMQPGAVEGTEEETESELSQQERQAEAAEEGTDGAVVAETEKRLEEEQGAGEPGGAFSETEEEKVEAETDLQKRLGEEVGPPTGKTEPVETQEEPGTTHEVSDVNEIIASRNLTEKPFVNIIEELSTPTLGLELRASEEPAEEPDDSSHSEALEQEAWKIGAIAAAFLLLLQTAVTVLYILKCTGKSSRTLTPKKVCARGHGGLKYDVTNTVTTIPIDGAIDVDDLSEYSQVQQDADEDVAMTTTPPDTTERNSCHELRTSVV